MRLLVTGGAGFIGSNFVISTLRERQDVDVTVLDSFTYAANPQSLEDLADPARCEVVRGDICDPELVDALIGRVDAVVHFAAESHNDNSLRDPGVFVRTNVGGTVTLLQAATRHRVRFHHISTDEVFGDLPLDNPELAFTPDSPFRPSSPYSASKAASDHFVRAWVRSFGLEATISHCSNNYGPRQHPEKFIPRQIINLLSGDEPRLYGTGHNIRDWIHVDDHNAAVWTILDKGAIGETYLIGADGQRRNIDVVRELNRIFGRDPEAFIHVTDRPGHDRRYAIDGTSTSLLGWEPQHRDFSEGLEQTVAWYRDNRQWWESAFANSEQKYRSYERPLS